MDVEARMALQPAPHGGVFVGGIIVGTQMDIQMRQRFAINLVEEAKKLLMAVALGTLAQDPPGFDVESSEQGHRAVPGLIVGPGCRMAGDQWQRRLCPLQGLDLALLIYRHYHGMVGRIDVEADHIAHFVDEGRIA